MQVTETALAGILNLGLTRAIQREKGNPPSRAKAHVCREVERLYESVPANIRAMTMDERPFKPNVETVWRKTQIKG